MNRKITLNLCKTVHDGKFLLILLNSANIILVKSSSSFFSRCGAVKLMGQWWCSAYNQCWWTLNHYMIHLNHCFYFQSVKWSFVGWWDFSKVMRSLKLTTGPDLPVRPIGPDVPLMASCGHKPKKNQNHQSRATTGEHRLSLPRGGGAVSAFVKDRSERSH